MFLVIGEKPSVAQALAKVLKAGKKEDGYFTGEKYLVSWCFGHLAEYASPESYDERYAKWDYSDLPIIPEKWELTVAKDKKGQLAVLKKLLCRNDLEYVVNACDAGREGELIFKHVYDLSGSTLPVKRLWISSMEDSAIREGFARLKDGAEYKNLCDAAVCRAKADWLVGINATRLFTVLYGKTLKIGRVQTPTLAMLVDRESKIINFKKEKYYMVHIVKDGLDAASERIDDKNKADEIMEACRNGQALVTSVVKEQKTAAPPKLYDLTTLQRDANRIFGFTAKQTLEYTQSLYEKKLCTYPRTDSQYLSDDMGQTVGNVIKAIFDKMPFVKDVIFNPDIKRILDSSKVTDHHAIIPTVEITKADLAALPEGEKKILFLTANRLLCATAGRHLYESVRAEISCGEHMFTISGKTVMDNGWKDFEDAFKRSFKVTEEKEGTDEKEKGLPELSEGMAFDDVQAEISEHYTAPIKRFTEDSLLAAMERAGCAEMDDDVERKGLGTPATRADIIEKLVRDGFVKREKKQMIPTEDGIKLITVIPDAIKTSKLTADWENALSLVAKGRYSMQEFMDGIADMVKDLVRTYHSVSDEQKAVFGANGRQEVLGRCPKCGSDVVKGKFGAYCKNKCGMNVGRAMGTALSDSQIKSMLEGKKTFVKGLKGKKGSYDAYLIPEGLEDYSYTKDGKVIKGTQYKVRLEFQKKQGR